MEDGTTATTPATGYNNDAAPSLSSSSSSSSFPLWAIIVVVVAGTAVVVGALVYGCTFLRRWRWARRHRRTVFIDGREVSVYHASSVSSSSASLTNRSSSILGGGGDRGPTGGVGGVGDDQSSLFFDDVEFWRAGGGWGSSSAGGGGGGGGGYVEDHYYYEDGDGRGDSEGGGGSRGRKLRKKKKRQRGGRSRSSGGGGFGGGTSSIMSELSVGDIVMMEAGIRREVSSSTKEGGSSSRRRRDHSISNNNSNDRREGGKHGKKTLSLPPTLPEVWRMSSGLLSVVSFASLNNLYNSLSSNNNAASQGHGNHSKEHHAAHERTMGGGGGSHRHHLRRTSNAWVDEDAIHGPAVHVGAKTGKGKGKSILASPVGSRKGSWRRSFRESWPLRTMISPTLPKLSSPWGSPFGSPLFGSPKPGGAGVGAMMSESSTMRSTSGTLDSHYPNHHGGGGYHHDGVVAFRFPNQPNLAPPHHGDDCRCCSDVIDYSPPRQLPKPPRQALLAANVESAGDSPLGNGYYRGSNWTGARTMPNLTLSRSGSGASTDRTLSYYKYEEMDYPVMLTNPQYHPAFAGAGTGTGNGNANGGGGNGGGGGPLGIAITTPRDSVVPAALRLSSADSTLSGILRDTEKRLQDGTVTGVVARRNQRISMSPSKRTLGASSTGPLRPTSASIYPSGTGGGGNEHIATLMITTAGGVHPAPTPAPPSPAPSPTKQPSRRTSGHVRQDSQASIVSEADSLFAEPSPVLDHYHALTSPVKNGGLGLSPSGPPPQQPVPPLPLARHNSFNGSMSSSGSSLPTIYSVDENADGDGDDTHITAFGSSTQENLNKIAGFVTSKESSSTLDDPFVVIGAASSATRTTSSPTRPITSGRRSVGAQPSSARSVPDFSQGPRLYGGPTSRSEASLRSDSPLGAISGNSSRAVDTRTRRSEPPPRSESRIPRAQTSQSQRNVALLPAPTSAFNTVDREHYHQKRDTVLDTKPDDAGHGGMDRSLTIPNIFLTTPSEKSDSPLPKRMEELRAQASSPTLGRGREETPGLAPPSPALSRQNSHLSSVYDYYMDMPSNDHRALSSYRRAAGEVRKMSETSSTAYPADQRDFERDKNKALDELNQLIRSERVDEGKSSRPLSTPTMGTTMDTTTSSVRLVPPEWLSNHMLVNRETKQSQNPSRSQPQHSTQIQVQTRNQEQAQHQDRSQNRKQPSLIPVSSTVAQLRRMNSQVSSYSNAASGYSDGSSASPFLPALMEGAPIVSPPRSRRDSTRNYLALGSPPRIVAGATRSEGGGGDSSKSDSGVNDKENKKHEASSSRPVSGPVAYASKIPKLDVKIERGSMFERKAPETPKKKRLTIHEKAASGNASGSGSGSGGRGGGTRASEDSLGLYDMDGFWISSSPERNSGFRM